MILLSTQVKMSSSVLLTTLFLLPFTTGKLDALSLLQKCINLF